MTRQVYHKLSVHDELLTPQAVQFKDIVVGEFFVRVYSSAPEERNVSRHALFQKILKDSFICDGKKSGDVVALDVSKGMDMGMHDTDLVIPVEVIMNLHLACFSSHTGPTGETG